MRGLRFLPFTFVLGACANVFGFQDLTAGDAGSDAFVSPDVGQDVTQEAAPPIDAAPEAETSLTCEGGTVMACNGQCVDIAVSQTSCGACGHDCGGGKCELGVCQPLLLKDSLAHPVFDIDTTNFYFNSGSKVLSCPLGGCKLQPTQVEDSQTEVYGSDSL